jgi:hypothetical protein
VPDAMDIIISMKTLSGSPIPNIHRETQAKQRVDPDGLYPILAIDGVFLEQNIFPKTI